MGSSLQDPSVPAATVEIPPRLIQEEAPAPSRLLEELKARENKPLNRDAAPEAGVGGALAATVFVIGLLLGAFLLLRKFMGRSRLFTSTSAMRILARRALAPKQEVILVEIGSRVLVVGATRDSLSRLGEVTGTEELAALRSRCGVAAPDAPPVRPVAALPPPAPETPSYDGVIEELSRIRTTVRDWTRQEVAP